jgi:hypothetical protein
MLAHGAQDPVRCAARHSTPLEEARPLAAVRTNAMLGLNRELLITILTTAKPLHLAFKFTTIVAA